MHEANISSLVRAYLTSHHLSQAKLADLASVNQSTVSRALTGGGLRHGSARFKLFTFIQQGMQVAVPSQGGADRVIGAFTRIWDGSEEHAAAVARIIEACEGLRPISPTRGEEP